MANFKDSSIELLKRLPKCKGDLKPNISIAKYSRFKTGGNAEIFFIPANEDDLKYFLENVSMTVPITIIGMGSNILIRDGGISGVTIIPTNFNKININNENQTIECGCFAGSMLIAQMAKKSSICGLEFLYCIPGTVGGGVKMNAGCFGFDYSNILQSVMTMDYKGNLKIYSNLNCGFGYRKSSIPDKEIIISTILQGHVDKNITPGIIEKNMINLMNKKKISQPVNELCAGSSFKNPDDYNAWELIRNTEANKLSRGDARVSDKHSNFIINSGKATSADIEDLGEEIRQMVYEKTGIMLQWEIKILGER